MPKKDVGHCEKPGGAVNERRSRDVRMGKPDREDLCHSYMNQIVYEREPGELKHLSTRRKRKHSQSSGERNGRSPNRSGETCEGVVGSGESEKSQREAEGYGKIRRRG